MNKEYETLFEKAINKAVEETEKIIDPEVKADLYIKIADTVNRTWAVGEIEALAPLKECKIEE